MAVFETEIIKIEDGKRTYSADVEFVPSEDMAIALYDFYDGSYGCESFYTRELTAEDCIKLTRIANRQDLPFVNLLVKGCFCDFIIHRFVRVGASDVQK